jgi:hypothetical protein
MNETKKRFLTTLYRVQFEQESSGINFRDWAETEGISQPEIDRAFDELHEAGLVEPPATGPFAALTVAGIQCVEQKRLVDAALISHQDQFRTRLYRCTCQSPG